MRKSEVIKQIGRERWDDFLEYMRGQTVGKYEDGETDFYESDVFRYGHKFPVRD